MWLAVNHNTSATSIRYSKRSARASKLGSCQSNLGLSSGYERLQKSKNSLKACFESVNILVFRHTVHCIMLKLMPNLCTSGIVLNEENQINLIPL